VTDKFTYNGVSVWMKRLGSNTSDRELPAMRSSEEHLLVQGVRNAVLD
jgi:hypothetical protein